MREEISTGKEQKITVQSSDRMDIRVIIAESCPKLSVTVENNEYNDDVRGITEAVRDYSENRIPMIYAYDDRRLITLAQSSIIRIYISNRKLKVVTNDGIYELRESLRDVEEKLDNSRFVRISQSEIINITSVRKFDFSVSGTIGVYFSNGESTWVARRKVKSVKDALLHYRNDMLSGK